MALIDINLASRRAKAVRKGTLVPPSVQRARSRAQSSPTTATKDISKQSQGLLFTPLNPTAGDTETDDKLNFFDKFLRSPFAFPFNIGFQAKDFFSGNNKSVTGAGSTDIGGFFDKLFGGIGSGFGNLFGNFAEETGKGFGAGLENIGLGAGKGLGSVGREAGTGFGIGFENIGKGFGAGVGAIGTGVGTAFEQTLGGVGRGTGTGISEIGTGLGGAFASLGGGIGSGIKQLSTPLLLLGGGLLLFNILKR